MKKLTEYINENLKTIVGVVLALTILGIFYWNKKVPDLPKKEEDLPEWVEGSKEKDGSEKKNTEKVDEDEIIVDVKGAVKKPGIYKLSSKNRVSDAVASAGGFTEEAERKGINLAKKLQDEAEVYVPLRGEADTNHLLENTENTNKTAKKAKININTADLTELQ
nr:SLBB domain-containing protein [Lactococcus formosensis]